MSFLASIKDFDPSIYTGVLQTCELKAQENTPTHKGLLVFLKAWQIFRASRYFSSLGFAPACCLGTLPVMFFWVEKKVENKTIKQIMQGLDLLSNVITKTMLFSHFYFLIKREGLGLINVTFTCAMIIVNIETVYGDASFQKLKKEFYSPRTSI